MYTKYIEEMKKAAKMRNLKERTLETYIYYCTTFLKATGKSPENLNCEDVRDFLLSKRDAGLKPATINLFCSSIHFFYRHVLHIPWDDLLIQRMLIDRALPTILTLEEIEILLNATKNLKHRAMFATMYSSGLRVSELVHLHYNDISRSTMQIHVRNTKNRVDRYTLLSERNLELLTEYWFKCGKPKEILFPHRYYPDQYLSTNSVEGAMRKALAASGLKKHVSPHSLRHSFATHLMENGVEQRYIQALLGHKDPQSTEIYLHVSNKTLMGIKSPFDQNRGVNND